MQTHAADTLELPASAVTVGAFDGVHLGHQALIRATCRRADSLEVPSVAYTFDPPPRHYFEGALVLTPLAEKLRRLAALGVDHAVVANFDAAYAARGAQSFLDELTYLNPLEVWVGSDFRFGRCGEGDSVALGARFEVRVFEPISCDSGAVVSSSRVRHLISWGKLEEAKMLLGWRAEAGAPYTTSKVRDIDPPRLKGASTGRMKVKLAHQ